MTEATQPRGRPTRSGTRQRDPAIEALRGIAVILMVAGHVIGGGNPNFGLHVARASIWDYSYFALVDIRMPLFTLISGYVYAMLPVANRQAYPRLVKAKSRRLLLPLITISTLLYTAKRLIPGVNSDDHHIAFWQIYFFQFEYLWFLQSIFLIFLVVGILDSFGLLGSRAHWSIATAVAAVVFVVVHVPADVDVFTLSGALRLLPFFLLGYGLRRHGVLDLRGASAALLALVFAGAFALRLLAVFGAYRPGEMANKAISVAVGVGALVLIYSARNMLNTRLLAWIGGFSFGIYLLHVFATAGSRVILVHLGVHSVLALFIVGVLLGVAAPIVFQLLFGDVWFVRTCMLGERAKKREPDLRVHPADKVDKVPAPADGFFGQFTPGRTPSRNRPWSSHPRNVMPE